MVCLIALGCFLFTATPVHPVKAETALADMMHGCELLVNTTDYKTLSEADMELAGECMGAVQEVTESETKLFCLPPQTKLKAVVASILPTLRAEMENFSSYHKTQFHDLVALALNCVFPCHNETFSLYGLDR